MGREKQPFWWWVCECLRLQKLRRGLQTSWQRRALYAWWIRPAESKVDNWEWDISKRIKNIKKYKRLIKIVRGQLTVIFGQKFFTVGHVWKLNKHIPGRRDVFQAEMGDFGGGDFSTGSRGKSVNWRVRHHRQQEAEGKSAEEERSKGKTEVSQIAKEQAKTWSTRMIFCFIHQLLTCIQHSY